MVVQRHDEYYTTIKRLDCTPSLVCQYIFVEYVNVQSDTRISLPSSLKT